MKKAIAIASLLIGVFVSALRGFAAFRGDKFYLNVQEVWLVAPNPEGPWASARGLGGSLDTGSESTIGGISGGNWISHQLSAARRWLFAKKPFKQSGRQDDRDDE